MKLILLCLFLNTSFSFAIPVNSNSISIATFNTWMIPALRKRANDRAKAIGTLTNEYSAVFFQEVFNKKQRRIINSTMNKHKSHYQKSRGLKLNSGLLNSSQFPIVEKSYMKFKECAKAQCLAMKGALRTRIQIGHKLIDVYNIHTQPFYSGRAIRKKQFLQLIKSINKRDPQRIIPTIVLGDFNIKAGNNEYEDINKLLANNHFKDAWSEKNGNIGGETWNSFINEWGQIIDREQRVRSKDRFDYIYVRDGEWRINLERVELILNEKIPLSNNGNDRHYLSDHFGVKAVLTLD